MAFTLARRGGAAGRESALALNLLAALGPRVIRQRRRDERALDRLWPGRAVNLRIWSEAAGTLGGRCRALDDAGRMEIDVGGVTLEVKFHVTPLDGESARELALDKNATHRLLAEAGVPVPEQIPFDFAEVNGVASVLGEEDWVVKPALGASGGRGVTTGVRDHDELRLAAIRAARNGPQEILERQAPGSEYRVLLLDGEPIGVVRRHRPTVYGDGHSSIADLVHAENRRRLVAGGEAGIRVITLDLDAVLALDHAGLTGRSVPADAQEVVVKGSRSQGGARDTETVSLGDLGSGLVDELRRASRALGLRLAGFDLITPDIGRSLGEAGGAVIEVNGTPGLHYHYLVREPAAATRVAIPILERMLSQAAGSGEVSAAPAGEGDASPRSGPEAGPTDSRPGGASAP